MEGQSHEAESCEKPYLPKPEDEKPKEDVGGMGPIGPWATGKVDWNPQGGITGARPVVDHYSITRYSESEWRKHNEEVLSCTADDLQRVKIFLKNCGGYGVDSVKVDFTAAHSGLVRVLVSEAHLEWVATMRQSLLSVVGVPLANIFDAKASLQATEALVLLPVPTLQWLEYDGFALKMLANGTPNSQLPRSPTRADFNSQRSLECISSMADKAQENTTIRLKERAGDLLRWKTEVERCIEVLNHEIATLEMERRRGGNIRGALAICRSINSECLKRRGFRDGYDLARDKVEEELIKEAALIDEVTLLLARTLQQVDEQQIRSRAMKDRLEGDWSDKNDAFNLTSENVFLKNDSRTIMFRPAAARFPENQSSDGGWENGCRELIATAEAVRNQSCELRALLEGPLLQDAMRDLKTQGEAVDMALARGISDLEQCINAMHQELDVVVKKNAESETLIHSLQQGIRGLDKAMKVAQTRLDNYLLRPGAENCRDKSQFSLMDEVKTLGEQSTAMKGQLQEAEEALLNLIHSRGTLEKELQNKLKTLDIDRNRCQICRLHYPTATIMSGF